MTDPHPQPIDPALFEVICAKEWFEKYGASMMPGYFEARISAYKRIEKERKTATHAPAAPAAPEPKCDDCRFVKECPLLYFPPCEQLARNDERHYREKANAEREKMLERLEGFRKYSNGEYNEAYLSDNEREMRIHNDYGCKIWGIMGSLRGGATEEGGERR